MTDLQQSAYQAANRLNDELNIAYTDVIEVNQPVISVALQNNDVAIILHIDITFDEIDIQLFNSSHDERQYYEVNDSYEPLYDHIKRKFAEVQQALFAVKL
jgi:hypothetical protein